MNRNYGVDWGTGSLVQIQPTKVSNKVKKGGDKLDECKDVCSECYRGEGPFSEPETKAIKAFFEENSKTIKFVMNFHSTGNMWIIPFNGKATNDIELRRPGMKEIFEEITQNGHFPKHVRMGGNSYSIIGDAIGGDMDDWVLDTYGIPSITSELGDDEQYKGYWENRSAQMALSIIKDNQDWI